MPSKAAQGGAALDPSRSLSSPVLCILDHAEQVPHGMVCALQCVQQPPLPAAVVGRAQLLASEARFKRWYCRCTPTCGSCAPVCACSRQWVWHAGHLQQAAAAWFVQTAMLA
jgi:hypothetical protein